MCFSVYLYSVNCIFQGDNGNQGRPGPPGPMGVGEPGTPVGENSVTTHIADIFIAITPFLCNA